MICCLSFFGTLHIESCATSMSKAETRKSAFSLRTPVEWNKLPRELRNCETVNSVQGKLKTYLFMIAYRWNSLILVTDCMIDNGDHFSAF